MKVVVVGAGYAGMIATNRLAKKVSEAEITVINPRPEFVPRVRLHQHIAGTGDIAAPITSLLREGITARVGNVDKIADGAVALDDGEQFAYDYAFLAVGSTVRPLSGTIPVGVWESAERARAACAALPAGSLVTVVGGGPTGIETAAEIAAARTDLRVRIVGSSVAGGFSPGARRRIRAGLERLRVDIVDDGVTKVVAGEGESDGLVHLRSGRAFTSDLSLWAMVSGVPDLAARSGLAVNQEGRALVDEFLRSVTDERIFAVGDCAAVPGSRFACQTAGPQGAHAADTLARIVRGLEPEPYSMGYVGVGVSLGRKDAVVQITRRDDTPRRAYLAAGPAVLLKEAACWGAEYGARTGAGAWLPGPK
ncbi:NAD(P)/FAD-dependent oxidoreductase [Nocardia mexicana]|uniref:NADH dehydrogenase FAD-containing subunit n=1 Tax=Nocardia mexicana TaxID=279262 RepID=A0A370GXL6_9NOCA|nr:FAD-dependent oxidoreductase [Nocardia mexicana]RDI47344.1 NADH dehydrogenase FAD-containing subunit [Nocardia mexicana]